MKFIRNIAFLLMSLSFLACEPEMTPEVETVDVSLTSNYVEFSRKKGGNTTFEIVTDGEWQLKELNNGISKWISVDPIQGSGNSTITVECIQDNVNEFDRYAVLEFTVSDKTCEFIVMQQASPSRHLSFSWKADSNAETVFAPDRADYQHFPYANNTSWRNVTQITDGKDGRVIVDGSTFREERSYIFNGREYTIGGYADNSYYYYPKGYKYIRFRNVYVSIPPIDNYRFSGVKATSDNASSNESFTIAKDKKGDDYIEDASKLSFGKPNPINLEFTDTEPGVEYYMVIQEDRYILDFTFSYELVDTL